MHTTDSPAEFWENQYAGRPETFTARPNALLVELAPTLPAGRALDLGCGAGGDTVYLATLGWQVTATDIAPTAVRRTERYAAKEGVADRVTGEVHDLAAGFPDGTFDLVSAQYFHTPFDFPRAQVLRRAAHALAPDGLLFIVDHGSTRPWAWNPEAAHSYPTPQEIHAQLRLDPDHYRPERLDAPQRQATGPSGETATVTDTVLLIRRRAS